MRYVVIIADLIVQVLFAFSRGVMHLLNNEQLIHGTCTRVVCSKWISATWSRVSIVLTPTTPAAVHHAAVRNLCVTSVYYTWCS